MKAILEKMAEVRSLFAAKEYAKALAAAGELSMLIADFWQRLYGGNLNAAPEVVDFEWDRLDEECTRLQEVVNTTQEIPALEVGVSITPDQVIQIINAVLSVLEMIRRRRQNRQ